MGPLRYEVHPGNVACGYHLYYYTVFLMLALIVFLGGGNYMWDKETSECIRLVFQPSRKWLISEIFKQ